MATKDVVKTSEQKIREAEAELTDAQLGSFVPRVLQLQEATQMESRKRVKQDAVPHESELLFRGRVIVGPDGNGVTADRFATSEGGDQVRHFLIVTEEVCRDQGPCPPPVHSITIRLNEDVVLQTSVEFDRDRVEVALNPAGEELNTILISASGPPGAVARVVVLAERPVNVPFGGLSVLPWALASDFVRTFLAVHNAGTEEIGFRLAFFEPDGSVAGRSAPQRLGRHATQNVNVNDVVASLALTWTRGAVHVEWVARGSSRVSTVASEERCGPNPDESRPVRDVRTLALDDYLPRPLTAAAAEEFLGLRAG